VWVRRRMEGVGGQGKSGRSEIALTRKNNVYNLSDRNPRLGAKRELENRGKNRGRGRGPTNHWEEPLDRRHQRALRVLGKETRMGVMTSRDRGLVGASLRGGPLNFTKGCMRCSRSLIDLSARSLGENYPERGRTLHVQGSDGGHDEEKGL